MKHRDHRKDTTVAASPGVPDGIPVHARPSPKSKAPGREPDSRPGKAISGSQFRDSGTRNPEPAIRNQSDPEYRAFAAQAVLERLKRVARELDGVRSGSDIEYVHRMRVASRRLRTALRLFEKCFPGKPFRRWQKELRAITRALGRARALDVQIEFVRAFESAGRDARFRPGVKRLLLRLSQKRERAQRKVLKWLADFGASGVSEKMTAALSPLVTQGAGRVPPAELREDARNWIQRGADELLEYESYVTRPRANEELHAMRIAAKHLRYTLEVFEPLFAEEGRTSSRLRVPRSEKNGTRNPEPGTRSSLHAALEAAKMVQSLLGTLHDCDVWLELLPRFLERESKRSLDFHGQHRAFRRLVPGIEHFRLSVVRLRRRTYREFAACWQEIRHDRVWESLSATVRGET